MMALNCDVVRDGLPDLLAGRLAGPEAQAILAHVTDCADCSEEVALLKALRQAPERAPAALAARIRQATPRRNLFGRYDLRRPALIAAAVASVLIGGSLLMRGRPGPAGNAPPANAPPATVSAAAPGGNQGSAHIAVGPAHPAASPDGRALMQALPGTAEAGLYSSTATLEDLSEEELNSLLKELQS